MNEKERDRLALENRLLKIERAVKQLMLNQIETKLEERGAIISLLDLDLGLDQAEPKTPGLV